MNEIDNDELVKAIYRISEGNPDTIAVITEIILQDPSIITIFDSLNIKGENFYAFCCNNNVLKSSQTLRILKSGIFSE